MGRHGPCLHCGIEHTVLWRAGPPEKTCLCNACGTWWRTKGSLGDYIPRHGIHEQSSLIHQRRAMPVKEVTNNQSGSGLVESIQNSCPDTRLPAAAKDKVKGFSIFSFKVPRRKRSVLPQYCLTGIGRLHRQLLEIQDEQQSEANTSVAGEEENDVLIDNTNWMHDVWK